MQTRQIIRDTIEIFTSNHTYSIRCNKHVRQYGIDYSTNFYKINNKIRPLNVNMFLKPNRDQHILKGPQSAVQYSISVNAETQIRHYLCLRPMLLPIKNY